MMAQTIQKKMITYYSLWLFAIFILMVGYMLITGKIFMTYADAAPWVYGYLGLALLGNIGVLIGAYYYLGLNSENAKMLVIYEVLFVIILLLAYFVISKTMLPGSIGNMNFETLLNAVLPVTFILLMLIEFVFSKAIKAMPVKTA
jgi:hypothetical protein